MGTKTQKLSNVVDQIVEWQSVFTGDGSTGLTAVAGRGYFIDTTSGAVTVTLPASPKIGDIVQLKDYARTWATNNVTIASTLLDGGTISTSFTTNGQTVTLVYMDDTKGWSLINDDTTSALLPAPTFIAATGGTVSTSGDFKIHTFTGDGCFAVSSIGNAPINPSGGPSVVDYLVVAGGGGTGGLACQTGGGGAGGFRLSNSTCMPAPLTSPLANPTGITVTATTYPVTVGAGGAPVPVPGGPASNPGSNSVFSTITSAGGGGGRCGSTPNIGQNGGSGGGSRCGTGATGNTPPVSPPQGNNGGDGDHVPPAYGSGGGGGAGAPGGNGTGPAGGGNGGIGSYVLQTGFAGCNGTPGPVGSVRYFAGGGGGADEFGAGTGGAGGGGAGACGNGGTAVAGTANTGGGAGSGNDVNGQGAAGGKGIVIIRYKYQ